MCVLSARYTFTTTCSCAVVAIYFGWKGLKELEKMQMKDEVVTNCMF